MNSRDPENSMVAGRSPGHRGMCRWESIAGTFQEEEGDQSKLVGDSYVKLSCMGVSVSSSQIFSAGFGISDYKSAFLSGPDAW